MRTRFLIVTALLIIAPVLAFAGQSSSTNFTVDTNVVDAGGAHGTSSNFNITGAAGQPATGISTSASFVVKGGFLYFPAVTVVPNAPSSLSASPVSLSKIDLSWISNSAGSEDGFSIERKTGAGGTYAVIAQAASGVTSFSDTSVSAATTYFYRVRAFIGANFSAYSNEASATTGSSGGGGGGGGGAYTPPTQTPNTSVTFAGSAYPLSKVVVLKDGQISLQTIAGPDANFYASLNGLAGGDYIFAVYGIDSTGRQSSLFSFPVSITIGATTNITGIFLSPTIDVDKEQVKRGDPLTIFGSSLPNAKVKIQVNSNQTLFLNATSNKNGTYLYEFDTSALDFGAHSAKAEAINANVISNYSLARGFSVGSQNIAAKPQSNTCGLKGDVNGDCHVDLIDFSILAYWYLRPMPPAKIDLNHDGIVNLSDFSILAYYWTG